VSQILFLCGLYLIGLLAGLLFKKRLPLAFLVFSGLVWGTFFYVAAATTLLALNAGYTLSKMALIGLVLMAIIVYFLLRNGTWRLSVRELALIVGMLAELVLVMVAANYFNFASATGDTFSHIMMGRTMMYTGRLTPNVILLLGNFAIWAPAMQSASVFLGVDYLYMLYPALGFSFLLTFAYLAYRALRPYFSRLAPALMLVGLGVAFLLSTNILFFQYFYMHNNFPAALHLLIAVVAFWLAEREKNSAWLVVAVVSLAGFCLTRVESPLFAIVYLALVVSRGACSYRTRLLITLPFLLPLVGWYVVLEQTISFEGKFLKPTVSLGIILCMLAFGGLVVLTGIRKIERLLLPKLPQAMLALLVLFVAASFALAPEHMWISLTAIYQNTFFDGLWSATWYILIPLLLAALWLPRFGFEEIFSYSIPLFMFLVIGLVFGRSPYHLAWSDSANRLMTQLAPIVIFYLLVKYGAVFANLPATDKVTSFSG
jgi:hypothetical protein